MSGSRCACTAAAFWFIALFQNFPAFGTQPPAIAPPAFSPAQARGAQGRDWDTVKQLPDWSGVWRFDDESFAKERDASHMAKPVPANAAPLNGIWEAKRLANGAANGGHGPDQGLDANAAQCIPNGMPGIMRAYPFSYEFLFTPGRVTIIPENQQLRRVFTDGRPHPADPDPTFAGHSIGYWEGDTLVIDTIGILPQAEIFQAMRQTAKTHVVERIRRIGDTRLRIDTVVTNPDMFARPFVYFSTFDKSKDEMREFYCAQNNRDTSARLDLTPPAE